MIAISAIGLRLVAVTLERLAEDMQYRNKYDAVIASEVIEHINDVDTFIGNINQLLKVQ
jgi:2-polyprenyl-3-methyl-5-hydroxy-6-metoxy-1,4-benzoquinol methylase